MSADNAPTPYEGNRTKPNPDQPERCPSIDPHDTLQCARRIHDDDQCQFGTLAWRKGTRPTPFVGSGALLTALYETYEAHIGITEPDGPDGPYIWCACGWRSDDLGPNSNPGASYAVHLTNAQHAAAVKALQPIVYRIPPG